MLGKVWDLSRWVRSDLSMPWVTVNCRSTARVDLEHPLLLSSLEEAAARQHEQQQMLFERCLLGAWGVSF